MPKFIDASIEDTPSGIEDIAHDIGDVYFIEKYAKATKESLKDEFFTEVTASFADKELAQKTVQIPSDVADSQEFEYLERYHPGWKYFAHHPNAPQEERRVILQEDPDFKQDSVTVAVEVEDDKGNTHPGYVVTKTIVKGSEMIDTDRLANVDPDLFNEVTEYQGYKWMADMLYHQNVDPDKIEKIVTDYVPENWPRVVKDNLSKAQIAKLAPYMYESPKQKRLNVRYAKDSDFE